MAAAGHVPGHHGACCSCGKRKGTAQLTMETDAVNIQSYVKDEVDDGEDSAIFGETRQLIVCNIIEVQALFCPICDSVAHELGSYGVSLGSSNNHV